MAMEEGTLVNWLVKEGDAVKIGDEVAEIESSKIVNVLESRHAGILRRRVAQQDDTLPLGALLGVIAGGDVPEADIDAFINGFTNVLDRPDQGVTEPASISAVSAAHGVSGSAPAATVAASGNHDDSELRATPSARRLARELGVNLHDCRATGSRGRVCEDDVREAGERLKAAPPAAAAPATRGTVVELPLSPMRQRIAQRLQAAAATIPHYRLISDACFDALLDRHKQIRQAATATRISINDLLVKACGLALVQVPECNVQFDGSLIKRFPHADISVAVALEEGLITPIIRAADTKDIGAIAAETAELVQRARAGVLKPEEYEGGTFTISNLGMFGIRQFDAIINPPQCAILAVGRSEQRVVVREGQPAVATLLTLTLSLDHRVIDGAVGAKFLQTLVNIIEHPELNIV
jgi:pyruvate dehydrogenase E2 component (dihydrolipoamide acetyltransferase)